jgi:hypothetical protein
MFYERLRALTVIMSACRAAYGGLSRQRVTVWTGLSLCAELVLPPRLTRCSPVLTSHATCVHIRRDKSGTERIPTVNFTTLVSWLSSLQQHERIPANMPERFRCASGWGPSTVDIAAAIGRPTSRSCQVPTGPANRTQVREGIGTLGGPRWGRNSAEPGGHKRTAGDNEPRGQRPFTALWPGVRNRWSELSHGRGQGPLCSDSSRP